MDIKLDIIKEFISLLLVEYDLDEDELLHIWTRHHREKVVEEEPEIMPTRLLQTKPRPPTQPKSGRNYLSVPYSDKNEAKALGAKFDWDTKQWYAPSNEHELLYRWGNMD
jgi:hypothetical protein